MMDKRKKILIIRLSALGDVAMTVPVIYSLAKQYPHLDVHVLTRPFFANLFVDKPDNVKVIEADFKSRFKGITGMLRLLRELGKYKFDCVADFHNVLRSWVVDAFFLIKGIPVKMVDKQRRGRKDVVKRHVKQANFINRYLGVLAKLGFAVSLDFGSVFHDGSTESPVGIEHPAVGIAPFARYSTKTYPLDKMLEVAKALEREGFYVYLFGGKNEAETLAGWQSVMSRCRSLAGEFRLYDELAIISNLDVMVTMDSANQHLASMVGTKTVTVWGGTTPICGFLGFGQDEGNAVCLGLPCQPCSIAGGAKCRLGHLKCLNDIAPEMIVEKVKAVLFRDNKNVL